MSNMSLIFILLINILLTNAFLPKMSIKTNRLTPSLKMQEDLVVSGNEGLLDTARMDRAFKGTGIKVPEHQRLKVGIIGSGLAGMITAMELSEAGHSVEIFDARRFYGGKVGSWIDRDGNHIEMGLHVFFGCYYNLFGIMKRVGAFNNLRLKEHTHTFINEGGRVGELDFRLGGIGAPINGLAAFARTSQLEIADKLANALALGTSPIVRALFDFDGGLQDVRNLDNISFSDWFISKGGSRGSIERMWDPICYALGFMDCDNTSARCMLTIFQLFAVRSEASILRMLDGSPNEMLHKPIVKYLEDRGVKINLNRRIQKLTYDKDENGVPTKINGFITGTGKGGETEEQNFDIVVAATDVPGAQKLLNEDFRKIPEFDRVHNLDAVPVVTVQLRFNGWVTELQDKQRMKDILGDQSDGRGGGIDNLLYSPDAEFSCFADLAVTSPGDFYKEGEGSLMQLVLTPGDKWMPESTEKIAMETLAQVKKLFPSAAELDCTWWNVVKLGKSLYAESPNMDVNRPKQATPIDNFFLAGSYTFQDYIDSMEGATKSGMLCADEILARTDKLQKFKKGAIREPVMDTPAESTEVKEEVSA